MIISEVVGFIVLAIFLSYGASLLPSLIMAFLLAVGAVILYKYWNGDFEPKNKEYRYEWQESSSSECQHLTVEAENREEADEKARLLSMKLMFGEVVTETGRLYPIN